MEEGEIRLDELQPRPWSSIGGRRYLPELNLVRVVASFMVVLCHALEQFGRPSSSAWGATWALLHASREIFFMMTALVLVYQGYDRSRFNWARFWARRIAWVGVPYLIWSTVYYILSFPHLGRFAAVNTDTSFWGCVGQYFSTLGSGIGQLYFVAMLLEFYLIFPGFLWLLRKLDRVHVPLLVVSLVVQIFLVAGLAETRSSDRQLWNYEFYLVLGAVVGARLPELNYWLRRLRNSLFLLCVLVILVSLEAYSLSLGSKADVVANAGPFALKYIGLNVAAGLLLLLLGRRWVSRPRPRVFSTLLRAASANTFGIFLVQGVAIDLLLRWHFGRVFGARNWVLTDFMVAWIVWFSGCALSSLLARTRLAVVVGRQQRPWYGMPALGRMQPVPRSLGETHSESEGPSAGPEDGTLTRLDRVATRPNKPRPSKAGAHDDTVISSA